MPTSKHVQAKIQLIDLRAQYHGLKREIDSALIELMEESNFIRGPKVAAFEKAFADYHGVSECVGLNSGTDALFLIFKALGVKPGDEVVTVPFTFIATTEAIVNAGASVELVDVDPERYTMDPKKLEAAITPRTVGIVPVHLYGTPADMDPILALAEKRGLWVVEDACQAHGALYKGKKVGSLGRAAAFSFYPSKNLGAYGDAGAVITRDASLAKTVALLRDHGQPTKYRSEIVGYNSRMDAFQAAILLIKLAHLDRWNQRRRTVATWYDRALAGVEGIRPPSTFKDAQGVYHLYATRAQRRDDLALHLEGHGISTATHYSVPVHQQTPFQSNGRPKSFPVSESLAREVLSLPMFPELTEEQVSYIADRVKEFYC